MRTLALHGFTATPLMWTGVAPDAFAPVLLGHDGRAPAQTDLRFVDEVNRIAASARRDLGRGAHVVGYSMGARVALALALFHPHLVRRLTLVSPNPGLRSDGARADRLALEARWCDVLEREGTAAFARAWEAMPMWASQNALPDDVRRRQRAARCSHDPRGLAAAVRALGLGAMPDLWPGLPGLTCPTHIVVGELDDSFRALAGEFAPRIPRARVSVVPGAGHNPILERPREVAALTVEEDDDDR